MIDFKFQNLPVINMRWWEPTQREWAPILLADLKPFWVKETDPNTGRPWRPLTPPYARWKQARYPGQPILRLTGKMQDEARIVPSGRGFSATTTFYGPYHQYGTRFMAARPWLGVPAVSLLKIAPIAWRNIITRQSRR